MVSLNHLETTLEEIRNAGLYKTERVITVPSSRVTETLEYVVPSL